MHTAIVALQAALGYAKWTKPEVRKQFQKTLNSIGKDLEEVEYDPGMDVVNDCVELNNVLDDIDRERERLEDELEEAAIPSVGESLNEDDTEE